MNPFFIILVVVKSSCGNGHLLIAGTLTLAKFNVLRDIEVNLYVALSIIGHGPRLIYAYTWVGYDIVRAYHAIILFYYISVAILIFWVNLVTFKLVSCIWSLSKTWCLSHRCDLVGAWSSILISGCSAEGLIGFWRYLVCNIFLLRVFYWFNWGLMMLQSINLILIGALLWFQSLI